MSERSYDPWRAYSASKLANLLFVRELDRRARRAGADLVSVGAHPGYARTNLVAAGPATGRRVTGAVLRAGTALVGQSARAGALPQLRAATDPEVRGGEYYGPRGPGEQRGLPKRARHQRERPRRPGRRAALGGVRAAHRRRRSTPSTAAAAPRG